MFVGDDPGEERHEVLCFVGELNRQRRQHAAVRVQHEHAHGAAFQAALVAFAVDAFQLRLFRLAAWIELVVVARYPDGNEILRQQTDDTLVGE